MFSVLFHHDIVNTAVVLYRIYQSLVSKNKKKEEEKTTQRDNSEMLVFIFIFSLNIAKIID
jgi:hypothetical protein